MRTFLIYLFLLSGICLQGFSQTEPPESIILVLDAHIKIGECKTDFWDFYKGKYIYTCDLKVETLDRKLVSSANAYQGEATVSRIWKEVYISKRGKWKKTLLHIMDVDCEVLGDRYCNWISEAKKNAGGDFLGTIVIKSRPNKGSRMKVGKMVFDESGKRK